MVLVTEIKCLLEKDRTQELPGRKDAESKVDGEEFRASLPCLPSLGTSVCSRTWKIIKTLFFGVFDRGLITQA